MYNVVATRKKSSNPGVITLFTDITDRSYRHFTDRSYTDIYRPLINTGHRTAGGLQELQTIFPTCQKAAAATMRDGADLMDA